MGGVGGLFEIGVDWLLSDWVMREGGWDVLDKEEVDDNEGKF